MGPELRNHRRAPSMRMLVTSHASSCGIVDDLFHVMRRVAIEGGIVMSVYR